MPSTTPCFDEAEAAAHQSVSIQSCEKEPIHMVNRIQPCGYLIVVDSCLTIVQCSTNAPELLTPEDKDSMLSVLGVPNAAAAAAVATTTCGSGDGEGQGQEQEERNGKGGEKRAGPGESIIRKALLDRIIGQPLNLLLHPEAVDQVRSVVQSCGSYPGRPSTTLGAGRGGGSGGSDGYDDSSDCEGDDSSSIYSNASSAAAAAAAPAAGHRRGSSFISRDGSYGASSDATRNFLIRSKGTFAPGGIVRGQSCSVIQSGEHFLLELEHMSTVDVGDGSGGTVSSGSGSFVVDDCGGVGGGGNSYENRDVMMFMEDMARELRKCWSIEEMASLVCGRIMAETPYDRGLVYRFDHDDSGEVIYESFRQDARLECRKDSFLGLRFPATDIPRQARELFMRNTLRFVYDVNGVDYPLYPAKVRSSMGGETYTDLSMCRLRGSSYMHLQYLKNMRVTSSMVTSIIVNKRLWGLYSFHGYRHALLPTARTRFLCEMASIMTSMIMESLTRMSDHNRLMEIEKVLCHLQKSSMTAFVEGFRDDLMELLDINLIAFRIHDDNEPILICTFGPDGVDISSEVFDCLLDTYGNVCKDYGVVFIDEQKSNSILNMMHLHTLAFYKLAGFDLLLGRRATVERVQWGGDPDKKLEPDGTLTPRNSFAVYVKNHRKKGRPWSDVDRQAVNRFVDQIEKHRSQALFREHAETIHTLRMEKKQAIDDARVNFDFFAHMAHELRTPFHGILGSLEAMREDPNLAQNELLKTAEMCGKNMIKILDDILLVAKGSYSLVLEEQSVDVSEFLKQSLGDMTSYAHMEGVSIRVRKEDVTHRYVQGDFNRVRQVINNLISNAIKFSDEDIIVEMLQRKTFVEVLSVWKTYKNMYNNCEPALKDVETNFDSSSTDKDEGLIWMIFSVIDKGIGISGADLKRLGVAFTQLSSGRQKKYQGTGLGINICNMLVTTLQGKLIMFSVPDFGSCFTFAVPVKKGSHNPGGDGQKAEKTADEEKKDKISRLRSHFDSIGLAEERFLKVLVVDDSSINRKLCTRKIKRWLPSINITECATGKSALEEFEYDRENIMGIFLDYHMHGMDGVECARIIREYEEMHEGAGHVYIAGYTADVLDECTERLLQAGMDSVIPKPEPVHAFESVLRGMMDMYEKNKRGRK